MNQADITPVIENIYQRVQTHRIKPGSFCRYLWQNDRRDRELGENPYGVADAANILYTINRFPAFDDPERTAFVRTLQNMQQEDGLYREKTHLPVHTTAHCTAALELFDAKPLSRVTPLLKFLDKTELYTLLDSLEWAGNPWDGSHVGAGVYAALSLTGETDAEWNNWYFSRLWEYQEKGTGFFTGGLSKEKQLAPPHYYMAGTFHYLFDLEYARLPLRYPEALIDTCLDIYRKGGFSEWFGTYADFLEIDWIFCLTRACRQTGYRYGEIRETLEEFTEKYLRFWFNADWEREESLNDMHMLFGGVCGLAELQSFLKDKLISAQPLRLVLDRRPFI